MLLALSTLTHAQNAWTLQTSAFSDAAPAAAAVEQLREAGFDAYSERFGEVVRVRVGCFLDRDSAEDVAASLAQRVDMQIVPMNPPSTSSPTFCVRLEAGFKLPAAWGVVNNAPDGITFWVDAAGRRYLRFDESGWRIYQNAARMNETVSAETDRQGRRSGQIVPIRVDFLLVGIGEPLWHSSSLDTQTLVVRGEDEIFTLTLTPGAVAVTSLNEGESQ